MMGLKAVRDVMTPDPVSVTRETSASRAAKLMAGNDVGPLPVVDDKTLVGIVTDRDLVVRVLAEDRDGRTPVGDVCTNDPIAVTPDEALDVALGLMERHQIRRLPVVEDGRLVGVLAQADLAREQPHERTGELVHEISGLGRR